MCVAVGLDQVAIATTGSTTWQTQAANNLSSFESLTSVSCASTSNCMAAGGSDADGPPSVMSTTDGAATWATAFAFPSSVQDLAAISCPSQSVCTAVGQVNGAQGTPGAVVRTTDGGSTWTSQSLPAGVGPLSGISCASALLCVTVGQSPGGTGAVIVTTTDGGATWQTQDVPSGVTQLQSLSCPSTTVCTAVGGTTNGDGAIITTTDGGTTWTSETPPSGTFQLSTISCPSVTTCFAETDIVSSSPVVTTTNGGVTWTGGAPLTNMFVDSISCPSTTVCTAIGSDESTGDLAVAGTTDGGTNWDNETLPGSLSVVVSGAFDISCSSPTACTAVGQEGGTGIAVATNDGGSTWSSENTPTPAPAWSLSGVSCPVADGCTAVGYEFPTATTEGAVILGQALTTTVLIPSNGATLSGSKAVLDASTAGTGAVTSVQFEVTGGTLSDQVVATAVLTIYGWIAQWNTITVPNGPYTLNSVATEVGGTTATSPGVTVTVDNSPLQTTVLVPSNGATLSGSKAVLDASTAGTGAVTSVQFEVTGGTLSDQVVATAVLTIYGWIAQWNTITVPNGPYTLNSVATEVGGTTATSPGVTVTVDNSPLQTTVLVPSNGATLSGSKAVLDASTAGTGAVTSVQFEVTGGTLSDQVVATAVLTIYGWIAQWNTITVPNGPYTLNSVATEVGGTTATSPGVTVTVEN